MKAALGVRQIFPQLISTPGRRPMFKSVPDREMKSIFSMVRLDVFDRFQPFP